MLNFKEYKESFTGGMALAGQFMKTATDYLNDREEQKDPSLKHERLKKDVMDSLSKLYHGTKEWNANDPSLKRIEQIYNAVKVLKRGPPPLPTSGQPTNP